MRLRCEECGAPVHLPVAGPASARRVGTRRCERCGEPVSLERVHELTGEADLDELLSRAGVPLLVEFHAEWCAPCKWLDPILDEVARSNAGRLLVAKVDTERLPGAAREHAITSLPTVIHFRNGREQGRSLGVEPERLRAMAGLDEPAGD